jgi:F-type H+-transporting ATPase subunit b
MLVDWYTVAAQALNFIILVWLMKRVLYKPIMAAIDARENLVAKELADAAAKKSSADKSEEEFTRRNEEFDRDRAALLAKATEAAKTESARLLEAGRSAADAQQIRRRDALQREMEDFGEAVGGRAQQAFFTLARRALKDLANASLEEQVITLFCERLRAMNSEGKDKLSAAIRASSEPVSIRSSFALPLKLQNTILSVINDTFGSPFAVRFEVAPDLVSGIELTAQGQRVGWSIADYLAALERSISGQLPLLVPVAAPSSPPKGATILTPAPLVAAAK